MPWCAWAATPLARPDARVRLDGLGYRALPQKMLSTSFSLQTLNFIDDDHILLTYNERKLIPRQPDDLPEQDLRLIRAVVVHVSTGKVEAETEWREYDYGQYLWPIRGGQFLFRRKNTLYVFHPGGHLHEKGDSVGAFDMHVLFSTDDVLESVRLSPNGSMLIVQTSKGKHIGDDPEEDSKEKKIQIVFFEIDVASASNIVMLRQIGRSEASHVVGISSNARGMLTVSNDGRSRWGFDYKGFAGGSRDLAGLESSCTPQPIFISESEFLAFGCRGGDELNEMGGFDLLGNALWLATVETPVWAMFESALRGGRFAYRTTAGPIVVDDSDSSSRVQIVHVYSNGSGEEILRAACSPVQRMGQNFALSTDGRKLAVLHNGAIEVFTLPVLTAKEEDALRKASQAAAQGELTPQESTRGEK